MSTANLSEPGSIAKLGLSFSSYPGSFYLSHVGIHADSEKDALEIAGLFSTMLGLQIGQSTGISNFVSPQIEVMYAPHPTAIHGHLGFHVDDVDAAEVWFEQRGLKFNEATRRKMDNGSTYLIYFEQNIAGFALHLTRG